MCATFYLGDEGENFKTIDAVRTRLEHLKRNASEFCGITLWQNWDTKIIESVIHVGAVIENRSSRVL